MKFSIRKQFAMIFIGLMAGTIILCWLLNIGFLEPYYTASKEKVLYSAKTQIALAAENDSYGTEEFQQTLNDVCRKYNIAVCIIDAQSMILYVSFNSGADLEKRLFGYIFGVQTDAARILEQGTDYRIQKTGPSNSEYLEMYGQLPDTGISYIMRTPMESIRESVAIANRFLAFVGFVSTMAGAAIIWFVLRKITKPVLELNRISERMVHLDFEAKYHGRAYNEIDLLGENINRLSESLEEAISGLKTANNELQRDIQKKEEIDAMRKEFLSNVSHELKTPIALIQGYAEGLKEGINDDPESRDFYCEVIMDEAGKMNNMVKKLLTLSQLESGSEVISMERFDVVNLIQNYIQSAGILTRQNQIEVCMEEYEPVYVWADEFKTEEVFMNYFSNAVNHCSGKKIIDVKLRQGDGKVRISVFNTGQPIPEDSIGHVWEKFYKVDKARTREYGGSGVGLSIVKAIMESMNQQYGVENFDNGVLFWFELETVQE